MHAQMHVQVGFFHENLFTSEVGASVLFALEQRVYPCLMYPQA
jgi:hypothetical protein